VPRSSREAVPCRTLSRRLSMSVARALFWVGLAALVPLAASSAHADAPSWPLSLGSCSILGARLGEVKTLYWDLYQHTEVCVTLAPEPTTASSTSALAFTFSFTYPGHELKVPPAQVLLRVQLSPSYVVSAPSLHLMLSNTERVDLTASEEAYRMTFPPGCATAGAGCGFTGIEVSLPREAFLRVVKATTISGEVFGMPFSFATDARRSLSTFAERLGPEPAQD
jgi:hypothetical protein